MNEDPAQDGNNWYGYAEGNPLRFTDPTGLVKYVTTQERTGNGWYNEYTEDPSDWNGQGNPYNFDDALKKTEGSRDQDENEKKRIKYLDDWIDKFDSGDEQTHKLVVDELMRALDDDGNSVSIYRDMMMVFHGKDGFIEALAQRL